MSLAIWVGAAALTLIAWKVCTMSDALKRLALSAASMTTVAESAVTVISGIGQQIRDAIAADNADEEGELASLADSLDAHATSLSDAIAANTAADGEIPGESEAGSEGSDVSGDEPQPVTGDESEGQ